MLKKLTLYISAVIIITYISLWIWAIYWIDKDKDISYFMVDNKNIRLEVAKFIWKITPAIDREKDAKRALIFSELSVNTEIPNFMKNIQKNYDFISLYYKNNEHRLSDSMKNKFLLRKLVFINRSNILKNKIKDVEFENLLEKIAQTIPQMNLEEQIEWNAEFAEFNLWKTMYADDNIKYKNKVTQYFMYLNDNIQEMNKKNNTTAYNIIASYHYAVLSCNTLRKIKEMSEKEKYINKLSTEILKNIKENITYKVSEYKILNDFIDKNLHYISLVFIITGKDLECSKAGENLLFKMAKIEKAMN